MQIPFFSNEITDFMSISCFFLRNCLASVEIHEFVRKPFGFIQKSAAATQTTILWNSQLCLLMLTSKIWKTNRDWQKQVFFSLSPHYYESCAADVFHNINDKQAKSIANKIGHVSYGLIYDLFIRSHCTHVIDNKPMKLVENLYLIELFPRERKNHR